METTIFKVFQDEIALKYVDGIAVHWYTDRWFPLPEALEEVHEEYPDKFILYTEACTGKFYTVKTSYIGSRSKYQA